MIELRPRPSFRTHPGLVYNGPRPALRQYHMHNFFKRTMHTTFRHGVAIVGYDLWGAECVITPTPFPPQWEVDRQTLVRAYVGPEHDDEAVRVISIVNNL